MGYSSLQLKALQHIKILAGKADDAQIRINGARITIHMEIPNMPDHPISVTRVNDNMTKLEEAHIDVRSAISDMNSWLDALLEEA